MLRAPPHKFEEKHNSLLELKKNAHFRTCVSRIVNACLPNDVEFLENNKSINKSLQDKINKHLKVIGRDVIESCFLCGFVPFYIRKVNGVPLPHVLPMGTFSWSVEICDSKSKKRKYENMVPVLRYNVRVEHGRISEDDILVVNYESPSITKRNESFMMSPVDYLIEMNNQMMELRQLWMKGRKWNSDKHVAITEDVNMNDQTTSGIQLLDDFRRYRLSGNAGLSNSAPRLGGSIMKQGSKTLDTVNEANFAWLEKVFKDQESPAVVHVLPPNMSVQELSSVELGTDLKEATDRFTSEIYSYFDLPMISDVTGSQASSAGAQLSKNQHQNIITMCLFLENVFSVVYTAMFNLPIDSVQCKITPQPRLSINGSDEIKALCDAGVFSELERHKLRKLYDMSN